MKSWKKIGVCILLCSLSISITGCDNKFVQYHFLREKPDKAMEKYLEEKYDDEFTCIDWTTEDTFNFYWDKTRFGADFESEKYPGKIIGCGAAVLKDGTGYKFWDDYHKRIYIDVFQEEMEQMAKKYFWGEYYVYTYTYGQSDDDTDPLMSFEEYLADDYHFGVCIFAEEMKEEEAILAKKEFKDEIKKQGILCNFHLGRINQSDISKEEFLKEMEDNSKVFDPWLKIGKLHYTNWIYNETEGEDVTWKYQRE